MKEKKYHHNQDFQTTPEEEIAVLKERIALLESQISKSETFKDTSRRIIDTISNNAHFLFAGIDKKEKTFYWNKGCEKYLGWSREQLIAKSLDIDEFIELFHASDSLSEKKQIRKNLEFCDGIFREYHPADRYGNVRFQLWSTIKVEDGVIIATGYDLTDRKAEAAEQQKQILEFETLFNNTSIGIAEFRDNRIIKRINRRGCEILGYREGELLGQSSEVVYLSPESYKEFEKKYHNLLIDGNTINIEQQLKRKDGTTIWCSMYGKAINPPALEEGVIWVIADITENREMREKLLLLASTDSLTGINNHRSFHEKAGELFSRASRYNKPISVLLADIDNFKLINDTYGHDAGDSVLKSMCENCRSLVREIDVFGRVGGEEFAVILEEAAVADALIVAERIRSRIEKINFESGGSSIRFTVSIGVASFRSSDIAFDEIMKRADLALYKAKRNGKNRVESV